MPPFTRSRGRRVIALAVLIALPLAAQQVPPRAYQSMHWRLVGPFRGGRALAVTGIPGDPTTFYFGAVDGGVWRTRDAGVTWEPLFDGQPVASIGALAVAPSDSRVLYVGTGEADMRSDITFGAGVWRSSDGGAHWTHVGLDDTRHIGKVVIDPKNPDIVWVAALGHAYGPNDARGIYRSDDGGRTWRKLLDRGPDVGAIDLALDPAEASTAFAVLWQTRRTPWSQYPPDEGRGSGVFKTSDGGRTWTPITGGGFPSPIGRTGLSLVRTPSGLRVYALVTDAPAAGLYRSDDGGASWRRTSVDPRLTSRGWYFGQVIASPRNPDVVYVPNVSLLRSTDGGQTFTSIKGAPGGDDYHDLWIDPTNDAHLIVGSDQGTVISLDGGATWSSWYNQPTAQFYHVAVDSAFPYRIYGAQQDAGTVGITSRGNDGMITFRDWHPIGAGEAGYIAPDPRDQNTVYGGDTYGAAFRFDWRTGQSQVISPWPVSLFGTPMPQRPLRFTWTSPIVFDPRDGHTMYMGAQVLLRTRDGGLHWDTLSADLTGMVEATRAAGGAPAVPTAAAQGWGVIYTIAPSPIHEGTIWIGTDDGLIHLTTDGGAHWQNVTPPALTPWSKVALIEASPFDERTAYAAVDRHRLDDPAPSIYRTRDGGAHWTRIDQGIAAGAYVNAVRADPARRGLLYAGTELGPYVSFDDGEHWQSLQLDLPTVSVRDLVVKDNDLVAATHGRGFWVLDDLAPLRQATDELLRASVALLKPDRAWRVRATTYGDTPIPTEEPHGENPPAGAVIDYWLAQDATGPVTITITDRAGHVVRRLSSDDEPPRDTTPPQLTSDWLPRLALPTRHAGHNRVVWDLRYPLPPAPQYGYSIFGVAGRGTTYEPDGPLALPGEYDVRLTVGNHTVTQPLRLVQDPRVTPAPGALESQLRLAIDTWNAGALQTSLSHSASDLLDAMRAIDARRLDRDTEALTRAMLPRVDSVARTLRALAFGELETVVQSADREPTQQSRALFASLSTQLALARASWERILARDVPALNARLAARHLAILHPIPVQPAALAAP